MKALFENETDKTLSTRQIVLRITVVISLMELLIMSIFATVLHELDNVTLALLDAVLLAILSAPLMYLWIIKPFVVARDKAVQDMTHMAYHDHLTELPNRRFLTEYLEKSLSLCARHKMYGALLLIDLNGFKEINDKYGHHAGDSVLKNVAKRLNSLSRNEDMVSRMGGDEFVVAIQSIANDEATALNNASKAAIRFQESLNLPIDFDGDSLQISASIGIRMLCTDNATVETLIRDADKAMYQAKQQGANNERPVFYRKLDGMN